MSDMTPGVSAPAAATQVLEPPAGVTDRSDVRLDALIDMMLPVTIEFGRTSMSVQDILALGAGSLVPLDRRVGDPVDIYVSDRRLAEGEVVVIGDTFGIRVTRILPVQRDNASRPGSR